jgi:hypothetical protein
MIRVPNNQSPITLDRDKAPSGFNTNKNYDLHSLLKKDFKET